MNKKQFVHFIMPLLFAGNLLAAPWRLDQASPEVQDVVVHSLTSSVKNVNIAFVQDHFGLPSDDCIGNEEEKRNLVRRVTAALNPYEWEDQGYWSKNWRVDGLFVDLNHDGILDALVSTPDEQAGRMFDWIPSVMSSNGVVKVEKELSDTIIMSCSPRAVYEATLVGEMRMLLAHDGCTEKYVSGKRVWQKSGDYVFRVTSEGRANPLMGNTVFDNVVRNPDFVRLSRMRPERYVGYGFRREVSVRPEKVPGVQDVKVGRFSLPGNVSSLVGRYRREVKQRLNVHHSVVVYCVFLDADGDGSVDCYISSSEECEAGGKYRWKLFLNAGDGFEEARERIWIRKGQRVDVGMMEPRVSAERNAFYLLTREDGWNQNLVLEYDGESLHSLAYLRLLSESERSSRPRKGRADLRTYQGDVEQWQSVVKKRLGFVPPKDFSDLLSYCQCLERLQCVEYGEGEVVE